MEEGKIPINCGRGSKFYQSGWVFLHIEGDASERGYQHGYLLANELKILKKSLEYLTPINTGKPWDFFVGAAVDLFYNRIGSELLNEIQGIANGAMDNGTDISWQEILAWNGYEEMTDYWFPNTKKTSNKIRPDNSHCSAFMAHGPATQDKSIVMAHNSWNNFEFGQFSNVILYIKPSKGNRMIMQSAPGYIESFADFFVTGAGIMGTETTIGGFNKYNKNEEPEFSRIRKAMQYTNNLDDFCDTLKNKNNGGYANAWLLGDIKSNTIMRFEIGLEYFLKEVNPHKDGIGRGDGWFTGFNVATSDEIRNLECSNTGFCDVRRHQGARQVRLKQLMDQYHGSINWVIAQHIISDTYDVYLNKENNPSSRTVDGHYELDDRAFMSQAGRPLPFQPRGAVDGKVCTSHMASIMCLAARWGNSSGIDFNAETFLEEHPQWDYLKDYLFDRPTQDWSVFLADSSISQELIYKALPGLQQKKKEENGEAQQGDESKKKTGKNQNEEQKTEITEEKTETKEENEEV